MQLADDTLTLAHGYILTRNDGVKICFTDHDCDIIVNGNNFTSARPLDLGHGEKNSGLAVDNNLLLGSFDIGALEENDLKLGKWAGAKAQIIIFNWQNPSEYSNVFSGNINNITQNDNGFELELAGAKYRLQNQIGRVISRNCDAILGDEKCGINLSLAGNFIDVTVAASIATDYFEISNNGMIADNYINGKILFRSGALTDFTVGIKAIVANANNNLIIPDMPLPILPALGDMVRLFVGCDKTFATCKGRFGNGDNFRGCPHLPGQSEVFSGPGIAGNSGGSRYD